MNATLPRCCVITPEPASASAADCAAFLDRLSAVLARGETLVQLRVKSLDAAAFARLAAEALARCDAAGAHLMLNGPIDAAGVMRLDGAGWHLDGTALRAATQRPLPAGRWVSAACHTRDDLRLAARAGAGFRHAVARVADAQPSRCADARLGTVRRAGRRGRHARLRARRHDTYPPRRCTPPRRLRHRRHSRVLVVRGLPCGAAGRRCARPLKRLPAHVVMRSGSDACHARRHHRCDARRV